MNWAEKWNVENVHIAHYKNSTSFRSLWSPSGVGKRRKKHDKMKSSIHIKPVKATSEKHNNREQDLNYVRKDLSPENSSIVMASIKETRAKIEQAYQANDPRGRKMPKTATPIREAVLLIKKEHTANDLADLAGKLEDRFGIKTIQAYAHKDEGHYDKLTKEWKPNYHAHMVFQWTDDNGKSLKLSKDDMSEMQTIVADHLKMERGIPSTKHHIDSNTFKAMKVEEDLAKIYKVEKILPAALKVINEAKTTQKDIEGLREAKTGLEKEVNELQGKTDLTRANLKYLENKTEVEREKLQEIEKKQSQSKEFRR